MTKYKIVGVLNLLLGILQALVVNLYLFSFFPEIEQLYADFQIRDELNLTVGYLSVFLIAAFAVANFIFGIKSFISPKQKNANFKYGVYTLVTTFILTLVLIASLVFTVFPQIYNLTSQF